MGIVLIISAIVTAIGTALGQITSTAKEILFKIWDAVHSLIRVFLDVAPTPLKVFIFLFLILSVSNIFSNFFLGMRYACHSTAGLYEIGTITGGLAYAFRSNLLDWSITDRDAHITSNFEQVTGEEDMVNLRCSADDVPKLYFYEVDILSYNLWILLLILIYGTPLAIKYYKSMGALH
jgi:hypothetical protein